MDMDGRGLLLTRGVRAGLVDHQKIFSSGGELPELSIRQFQMTALTATSAS